MCVWVCWCLLPFLLCHIKGFCLITSSQVRKRKKVVKKVRFFLRIFRLHLRIFDVFKVLRQQSIYCQENNISYAPTTNFVSGKMCHVKKRMLDAWNVMVLVLILKGGSYWWRFNGRTNICLRFKETQGKIIS